jgi:anti-anti-sigma factor
VPGSGSPADLRIQIDEVDGVTVLVLAGELDITGTARLGDALTGCSLARGRLEVDVSGLAFMDLAGLRGLLCAHSRLLGAGRPGIMVCGAGDSVRRIFELTGFASLLGDAPPLAGHGHLLPYAAG